MGNEEWEVLCVWRGIYTERLRVPTGWLYSVRSSLGQQVCFVPEVEAQRDVATEFALADTATRLRNGKRNRALEEAAQEAIGEAVLEREAAERALATVKKELAHSKEANEQLLGACRSREKERDVVRAELAAVKEQLREVNND